MMQETIFKPKYQMRLYLGPFLFIPIEFYLLWQILSGKDSRLETILAAAFFGLMGVLMPYLFSRRITFTANAFLIEKYLWPTKKIEYMDVIDIGTTMIITRNGNLPIQSMKNSGELRDLIAQLIEQGKISHDQIGNKLIVREAMSKMAFYPAVITSLVLWFIASFIWPYEKSMLRDLSLIGFFIPVYFLIYMFMKNRVGKS